jgi:magnesium transporter
VSTLIAGIYGMNFEYMPELDFRYGYFVALGLMAIATVVLWKQFKKRGWL